jgi:hypothetical protein
MARRYATSKMLAINFALDPDLDALEVGAVLNKVRTLVAGHCFTPTSSTYEFGNSDIWRVGAGKLNER